MIKYISISNSVHKYVVFFKYDKKVYFYIPTSSRYL